MSEGEATSRLSDNPFRDPNLPPDKVDYLDRRKEHPVLVTEATTVEELIAAHHDGRPITFEEGVDTAGFFCPGCGAWMDAGEATE